MVFRKGYIMGKYALLFAVAAGFAAPVFARLETVNLFSDFMVLQHGMQIPVWGTGEQGAKIRVEFAGQVKETVADGSWRWKVVLDPLEISTDGMEMEISDDLGGRIVYRDILVGDVWLCSGQSNMEMNFNWGVCDGDKTIAEAAEYPLIRHVKMANETSIDEERFVVSTHWNTRWRRACDDMGNVTACGYYFARSVFEKTGIPIGILEAAWSGCKIEPFISYYGYTTVPELAPQLEKLSELSPQCEKGRAAMEWLCTQLEQWTADSRRRFAAGDYNVLRNPQLWDYSSVDGATAQYNRMIAPVAAFPVKGAIWYQGCSNGGEGDSYVWKMRALVNGWRHAWGYDFPFYYAQIAALEEPGEEPGRGGGFAPVREAQRKALAVIGNCGMASTIDAGDRYDIHPKSKKLIGERLALWALNRDYGFSDIVVSGPLFKSLEIEGDKAIVSFDYADCGLVAAEKKVPMDNEPPVETPGEALKGFAIAGEDRVWHWANAEIDGDKVVVSSGQVAKPVAVRYAYDKNPLFRANLYNKALLPASPFKSDDW